MSRRAAVVLVAYAVVMATVWLTPLMDSSLWWLALWPALHLVLGLGVARVWVLAVPPAFALVVSLWGDVAWAIFLAVVLTGCTLLGWAIGRASDRVRSGAAVFAGAAAVVLAAWGLFLAIQRQGPLPAAVQARLPLEVSLGNLCPGAGSSPDLERDVRARADRLVHELQERPHHTVTFTQQYSHGGEDEVEITVRQLAQDQLADLESGEPGASCAPDLQRRLRAAL